MTDLDISIFELPESDWEQWRTLRLEALRDAPGAFGETLAAALERDEDSWHRAWRAEPPLPRFIAAIDGTPQGMCSIVLPEDHDFQPLIISMWIAPAARGRGLGQVLLDACVGWCARNGYRRLRLGVVEDNEPATRLYTRYGFRFDGSGEPLLSEPSKQVRWMELPIEPNIETGTGADVETGTSSDAPNPAATPKPFAVPRPASADAAKPIGMAEPELTN